MQKIISIIVPIYNTGRYLERCVDSLLNQTFQNIEIILVNDGSFDNSGEICDKYAAKDCRIKVIHKVNGGVSSARNAGLNLASGQYIMFCDSDDYVDVKWCESLYAAQSIYPKSFICCNIERGADVRGGKAQI